MNEEELEMLAQQAAGLSVEEIEAIAKGVAEAQDKITKMGRELGVSTEFLSSLEFSAKLLSI